MSRSTSTSWLTVTRPSDHAATRAALSTETAGPTSSGTGSGSSQKARPVDRHEPVVADLLTVQHPPDDVDALLQALGANLLARPAVSGDVLVARLTTAEGHPEPAGNICPSVAIFWAWTAGW